MLLFFFFFLLLQPFFFSRTHAVQHKGQWQRLYKSVSKSPSTPQTGTFLHIPLILILYLFCNILLQCWRRAAAFICHYCLLADMIQPSSNSTLSCDVDWLADTSLSRILPLLVFAKINIEHEAETWRNVSVFLIFFFFISFWQLTIVGWSWELAWPVGEERRRSEWLHGNYDNKNKNNIHWMGWRVLKSTCYKSSI